MVLLLLLLLLLSLSPEKIVRRTDRTNENVRNGASPSRTLPPPIPLTLLLLQPLPLWTSKQQIPTTSAVVVVKVVSLFPDPFPFSSSVLRDVVLAAGKACLQRQRSESAE